MGRAGEDKDKGRPGEDKLIGRPREDKDKVRPGEDKFQINPKAIFGPLFPGPKKTATTTASPIATVEAGVILKQEPTSKPNSDGDMSTDDVLLVVLVPVLILGLLFILLFMRKRKKLKSVGLENPAPPPEVNQSSKPTQGGNFKSNGTSSDNEGHEDSTEVKVKEELTKEDLDEYREKYIQQQQAEQERFQRLLREDYISNPDYQGAISQQHLEAESNWNDEECLSHREFRQQELDELAKANTKLEQEHRAQEEQFVNAKVSRLEQLERELGLETQREIYKNESEYDYTARNAYDTSAVQEFNNGADDAGFISDDYKSATTDINENYR